MAANLPSGYGTQVEYSNYYKALPDSTPDHGNTTENAQHTAMLELVPRDDTTKIYAADSGNWSVANNWYPHGVPGAADKVLIGEGVEVTYNVDSPTTELAWLRVDGTLTFATDQDTSMLVETIVTTGTSEWVQGSVDDPILSAFTSEVIFASNGPIDTDVDTFMLSRGAMWHGHTHIHGAEKLPFTRYVASISGPTVGATTITTTETPTGWENGDEIVIGGTRRRGWYWTGSWGDYHGHMAEKVTITNIAGNVITFTPALWNDHSIYSHSHPSFVMRPFVVNLTRNIKFRPETPQTIYAQDHTTMRLNSTTMPNGTRNGTERPHTMFMHSHHVDARWAEFKGLGRTHKAQHSRLVHTGTIGTGAGTAPNGSFATAGVVTFDTLFKVQIGGITPSASNTLTVTGTDQDGNAQTEVFTAATNGVKYFKTVTNLKMSSGSVGGSTVGINAVASAMTELGVRNRKGSENPASWSYEEINPKSNIQGRYPVHIHKTGIEDLADIAVLRGISVHESPSWCIAHHQSHVLVQDCVGHDFMGAGLVGEDGNESGAWRNNCMIGSRGGNGDITHKAQSDQFNKDPARDAPGFWFTGRIIKVDGIYTSDCYGGAVYNVRLGNASLLRSQFDQWELTRGRETDSIDQAPIRHFKNSENVALNSECFIVIKASANQGHGVRTIIDNVIGWSVRNGNAFTYTAHYTSRNCIFIGGPGVPFASQSASGQSFGTNSSDQSVENLYVENMQVGFSYFHDHTTPGYDTNPLDGRFLVDFEGVGNAADITHYNAAIDLNITSEDLDEVTPTVVMDTSPLTFTAGTGYGDYVTNFGTLTDEYGVRDFPYGTEGYTGTRFEGYDKPRIISARGVFRHTNNKKYVYWPEWFSSAYSGELFCTMVPIECTTNWASTANAAHQWGDCDLFSGADPALADFEVTTAVGTPVTVDIVGRATHPDDENMYLTGYDTGFTHFVTDNGNGTITVYPIPDYEGSETIKVFIHDQNANVTSAFMTITTVGEEELPDLQAVPDSASADFETAVTFDVLANDIGTSLEITDQTVTGGVGVGTIAPHMDGVSLTFTPATDFTGNATGTYEVTDGAMQTDTTSWSVFVAQEVIPEPPEPLDPPVANGGDGRGHWGRSVMFNITQNDTDPQDAPIFLTAVAPAEGSTARLVDHTIDGEVSILPSYGFVGDLVVQYVISNGETSDTGTWVLNIVEAAGWRP